MTRWYRDRAAWITRQGARASWRLGRIALPTALLGAGYTVFSEWMNITILGSWAYDESMPTLNLPGFKLGLSPLAQWLVVPPLALFLALSLGRSGRRRPG